jgi:glycosyltransferase involved in cell wall biosynthesis
MRISVVLPAHNAGRWVEAAIRSVAEQTRKASEIIVVNDRSSDDTGDRVAATGLATRIITTDFGNGAAARNAGILAATGDWIAFQDADDQWYPNHLDRAEKLLSGASDVAYMSFSHPFLDEPGEPTIERENPWPFSEPTRGIDYRRYPELVMIQVNFATPAVVARRDRLIEVGMFDAEQVRRHDIDMWLRVIAGHTWSYDPLATIRFRMAAPGGVSSNVPEREYYWFRALWKNRASYEGPAMDRLIAQAARRAVSAAYTDGNREHRRRALAIAEPFLPWRDRLLFAACAPIPGVFRAVNQARRRWRRSAQAESECR